MTSRDYAALAALAARQQGSYHRDQAAACGIDRFALSRDVRSGRAVRAGPDVFRIAGAPDTFVGGLWVAHLSVPRSIVSVEAAAQVRGLEGMWRGRRVVTTTHGDRRTVPGVTIHQTRDPWPIEHTLVDGLPVTTARRLLIDAAAVLTRARYVHLVQGAIISGQTSLDSVGALAATLWRPGKRRFGLVTATLDDLGGEPESQSVLEARLHGLVSEAGLPPLRAQVPVPGRGGVRGCVDGEWSDALVIVEVDGRKWHARYAQMSLDRDRDGQAAEAGYLTHRIMREHLVGDREACIERLRRIRAMRLLQLRRSA